MLEYQSIQVVETKSPNQIKKTNTIFLESRRQRSFEANFVLKKVVKLRKECAECTEKR